MPAPAAPSTSGRFAQAGVQALTVLVFAAVVLAVTLALRVGVRAQILQQRALMLGAVTAMQLENRAADLGDLPVGDVPGALLTAVLRTSKLAGVEAVRVFNLDRSFHAAWPFPWSLDPAPAADWAGLTRGEPLARLHRTANLEDIVAVATAADDGPWLEAWVPLQRLSASAPIGVAQFWVRAGPVAEELAAHDRRLWTQAAIAWLVGSMVIVLALEWAFRRLAAANHTLRLRTEDLQRANRELVLAAKTSALGTITAHLMHELKNPLAGLEVIVAGQADGAARSEGGGELAAASALTRRLRGMVNDVVAVLRDEQSGAEFELTAADVAELAAAKVRVEAAARGVRLEVSAPESVTLAGRRANLVTLVLRNLLQNALEATPAGGTLRVVGRSGGGDRVEFDVSDSGPGLPEPVRARLFQPCTSGKLGGSGIGLALSHQLAQQAGGRLELRQTGPQGTTFRLVLAPEA